MKIRRFLLVALLSAASLLAPTVQAKTIFERLAPPLLPIPVPVVVASSSDWRDDAPRYEDHHERRRERYEDRRDWREDRRDWRDDHYRHDHRDWHHDHDRRW